jgi:aryl-alcohol dehydrogenase-like predicted oxidoreductase
MEKREIGNSGIRVSVIGLGCNNFGIFQDAAQAAACVHQALDLGINFFDMASEHGAGMEEELVAAAIGSRRADVVIATKFGQRELLRLGADGAAQMSGYDSRRGLSYRWIMQSVEESLRRLRTDYIDLYQTHASDTTTPREETLRALDDLVRQGKVRAIGDALPFHERSLAATPAELAASQDLAAANGLTQFVSLQTQYNLLAREVEAEILPELRKRGMGLLPYSPLANGLLTGKYRQNEQYPAGSRLDKLPFARRLAEEKWKNMELVRIFATDRGIPMIDVAIAWLLSEPLVASVIAGATRPEQVAHNAAAAATNLTQADLAELNRTLA